SSFSSVGLLVQQVLMAHLVLPLVVQMVLRRTIYTCANEEQRSPELQQLFFPASFCQHGQRPGDPV
ncbi:unnamed protein product, partial [Durusdinium trenchii]